MLRNVHTCVTDLCVSAALDAVKEGVTLPWNVPPHPGVQPETASNVEINVNNEADVTQNATNTTLTDGAVHPDKVDDDAKLPRKLHLRHFNKALREITPSSSESLGSLSALRKWNEEFGEGQTKKRKVMWGKGLFGFAEIGEGIPDGKVSVQDRSATEVEHRKSEDT